MIASPHVLGAGHHRGWKIWHGFGCSVHGRRRASGQCGLWEDEASRISEASSVYETGGLASAHDHGRAQVALPCRRRIPGTARDNILPRPLLVWSFWGNKRTRRSHTRAGAVVVLCSVVTTRHLLHLQGLAFGFVQINNHDDFFDVKTEHRFAGDGSVFRDGTLYRNI